MISLTATTTTKQMQFLLKVDEEVMLNQQKPILKSECFDDSKHD
jgi:hypothetical protein